VKLSAVRVFVRDWDAACEFYEQRLGLTPRFRSDAGGWAGFDVGGPVLIIERVAADDAIGDELVGRFVGASLQVEDMQQAYTELRERGVPFDGTPERQDWGGMLAFFRDPDGNTLSLDGPVERGRPRRKPAHGRRLQR